MEELDEHMLNLVVVKNNLLSAVRDISKLSIYLSSEPVSNEYRLSMDLVIPHMKEFVDIISMKEQWQKDDIITAFKEVFSMGNLQRLKRRNN